jgi:hypothetical protein
MLLPLIALHNDTEIADALHQEFSTRGPSNVFRAALVYFLYFAYFVNLYDEIYFPEIRKTSFVNFVRNWQ